MRCVTKKKGFLTTELIYATAIAFVSLTLIIKWHSVLATHRATALRKLDMIRQASSLIERLQVDDHFRQTGRMKNQSYEYIWRVHSVSFELADQIFGKSITPGFGSTIELKVIWHDAQGVERTSTFQGPLA
ncbi:MAG TPA: hypothetical protein VHO47_02690 [Candidatus Babeliales bacterium]|nr:hypothetical protein [Candidatus Babeliales bacterium]